jgi:hypothetical protein
MTPTPPTTTRTNDPQHNAEENCSKNCKRFSAAAAEWEEKEEDWEKESKIGSETDQNCSRQTLNFALPIIQTPYKTPPTYLPTYLLGQLSAALGV